MYVLVKLENYAYVLGHDASHSLQTQHYIPSVIVARGHVAQFILY